MKPRHVVTYNLMFILKRLILAILLVSYRVLTGNIMTYIIAVVHLVFLFHFFICCCWYMSIFKKFLHVVTDLLVFVVLLFPVYQNSFHNDVRAGHFIIYFFSIGILLCIIVSFLAWIPRIILACYWRYKEKNQGSTFPKEKKPYDPNKIIVQTA